MSRTSNIEVLVARTSFVTTIGGQEFAVKRGDRRRADHPVVQANPALWVADGELDETSPITIAEPKVFTEQLVNRTALASTPLRHRLRAVSDGSFSRRDDHHDFVVHWVWHAGEIVDDRDFVVADVLGKHRKAFSSVVDEVLNEPVHGFTVSR